MKKFITIFLLLSMILSPTLVSCSNNSSSGDNNKTETTQSGDSSSDSQSGSAETESDRIQPTLPDTKYNGQEIRIMAHPSSGGGWQEWYSRDVDAEELSGEIINDAVYDRNLAVEERFDVVITGIEVADQPGDIQKQVLAGTDDFHISTARIQSLPATVQGGYLVNLYEMPWIDLTKPWYDQTVIESASLFDQLYYVTGDMIILDDDSTAAMLFNKALIEDMGLENPYELVSDKKWTYDKMLEMMNGVSGDVDGNGKNDEFDRYGFVWQHDAVISMIHGGGVKVVEKNAQGVPEITLENEHAYDVVNKVYELMSSKTDSLNLHSYDGKYEDIYELQAEMFKENRALFTWIRMRMVERLRDMEADFGIIPVPMYSETQESYYNTLTKYTAGTICIPRSDALDMDMIGAVVEALSAEGMYTLREAYFEKNLGSKIARDPESTEMLEIIMSTRVVDTGDIYDIGGLSGLMYSLDGITNFSSNISKKMKAANKYLEKFIESFEEMAEEN